MIDLACGVIRISDKSSCLEIFDQQGNPNLTSLVVISISFGIRVLGLISLSFGIRPFPWFHIIEEN